MDNDFYNFFLMEFLFNKSLEQAIISIKISPKTVYEEQNSSGWTIIATLILDNF
jgi:hypothetical protein